MPEQEATAPRGTPTEEVGAFLSRRRERIAQRWADEPLFRAVFTVSRDEAVEAGRGLADALAHALHGLGADIVRAAPGGAGPR